MSRASSSTVRSSVALNVVGTIGRLVLFRLAGKAFNDELQDILGWVQRYQWWLVGISLVFVAITLFRSGGFETPEELAEEIEAEEESLRDE